ncbi:MAG: methyltransferase [Clostridia bacterium]|nr:methyltransferase [Clostridia bacterium]
MAKLLHTLDDTHSIYQHSDGFLFGTDAVLLAAFIRTRKNKVGVEFGTGTGIIPLLLSIHKEFKHLYAIEIQEDYASLARENLALNGFSHRVDVVCGDLKEAARLVPSPCDFVFCNPPYMKKESGKENLNEKKRIARHEILCDIEDVCRSAASLLQDKGEFFCVYRLDRMAELFFSLKKNLLEPKDVVFVTPKPDSIPSLILVRAVKGARPGLLTRRPFVVQDESGEKTAECQRLYETGMMEYGRQKK